MNSFKVRRLDKTGCKTLSSVSWSNTPPRHLSPEDPEEETDRGRAKVQRSPFLISHTGESRVVDAECCSCQTKPNRDIEMHLVSAAQRISISQAVANENPINNFSLIPTTVNIRIQYGKKKISLNVNRTLTL